MIWFDKWLYKKTRNMWDNRHKYEEQLKERDYIKMSTLQGAMVERGRPEGDGWYAPGVPAPCALARAYGREQRLVNGHIRNAIVRPVLPPGPVPGQGAVRSGLDHRTAPANGNCMVLPGSSGRGGQSRCAKTVGAGVPALNYLR